MLRCTLRFALPALCAFFLAAPALAGEAMVHIYHDKVDPAEVKIAPGDKVVFHNMVEMPGGHTVVADDGSFESPALDKDAKFERAFDEPGRHPFHVKQHPKTTGVVVVE